MSDINVSIVTTHAQFPGFEFRKVGNLQYELWKNGEHLGNYKDDDSFQSDSFACGFFAGMLSAKKD